MTDTTISALLKTDPQRAMEHIITDYTGLLWSVAGQWLQEPEDIKDCINETFVEFYIHHDRYDPIRGSLKAYLAVIARRTAMRHNAEQMHCRSVDNHPQQEDPFLQTEQRDELDAALHTLDPQDEQIIRMKYYGGMTARDIAEQLNLPYETVKKRHQRSLKKMKKALTIGLVIAALIALLAACGYAVLRYFGVWPGYGVSTDPQSTFYILETGETLHTERFDLSITDAWWSDGVLIADTQLHFADAEANYNPQPQADGTTQTVFAPVVPAPETAGGGTDWTRLRTVILASDNGAATRIRYVFAGVPKSTGDLELTLTAEGGESGLVLAPGGPALTPEEAGCCAITEEGGLLAVPRIENGELIVSIYPLDIGQFRTNVSLTMGFWEGFGGPSAPVTVTTPEGEVQTGRPMGYNPYSYSEYLDWNFGPAEAGTFTLNVPYVYQTPAESRILEWELTDPTMTEAEVPGGSITFTDLAPAEYAERIFCGEEARIFPAEQYEAYNWWTLEAQWHFDDSDRTLAMAVPTLSFTQPPVQLADGLYADAGLIPRSREAADDTGAAFHSLDGYVLYTNDPATSLVLRLDTVNLCYRWDQEFELTFTVE